VHCESQLKQVLQHLPAIQRYFLTSHFPQLFCCAHVCLPSGGTSLQLGTAVVGAAVGSELGAAVGSELGAAVGFELGLPVGRWECGLWECG